MKTFYLLQKLTWRLMLSLLHGKQNLWWLTDGHCTKWVSSSLSWQIVHFNVGLGAAGLGPVLGTPLTSGIPPGGRFPLVGTPFPFPFPMAGAILLLFDCCASVDVTVVLETCLEPEDRRPLDEPAQIIKPLRNKCTKILGREHTWAGRVLAAPGSRSGWWRPRRTWSVSGPIWTAWR